VIDARGIGEAPLAHDVTEHFQGFELHTKDDSIAIAYINMQQYYVF
jgi:hypothetical protein